METEGDSGRADPPAREFGALLLLSLANDRAKTVKNARFFTVFAWSGPKTGGEGAPNSRAGQPLEFGGVGEGGKEKNRRENIKKERRKENRGGEKRKKRKEERKGAGRAISL